MESTDDEGVSGIGDQIDEGVDCAVEMRASMLWAALHDLVTVVDSVGGYHSPADLETIRNARSILKSTIRPCKDADE